MMNNTEAVADREDHLNICEDEAIKEKPEGGLQAWLTVLGSTLVYFPSFGFITSYGFFQTYYQQEYLTGFPPSTIAFIGTLQITLLYLLSPVTGALFDAYGLRYLYLVGGIGCSASLLALSFTQPEQIWQQYLTQGVLFGLSVSFGIQPANAVVGQYFNRKRALVMGIVAGSSSIGGVCLPIMFSNLIPKIGFAWSIRVAALMFMCCYTAAIFVSQPNLPRKPLKSPREMLDFGGYKDPRYTAIAVGGLIVNFGLYVPYYYLESYVDVASFSPTLKSYLLPMINGFSFFGRVLGGYAADKLGRLNILYPMTIFSGILCFALWLPSHDVSYLVAFASLYGFGTGIFISVGPAAITQTCPDDKIGARLGAFQCLLAVATLTGTPIGGAIVQEQTMQRYIGLVIFTGVTIVFGGCLLFVARLLFDRKLSKKF